jgi:predicted hotdog family 3-hydroxylacyl-ACP dehydratase
MRLDYLPVTREQIAALIPHQGTMCLLDSVQESTPDRIICLTRSHASPENPLRHHGRLSAVHLCEYGAQAMALHGGLTASVAGLRPQSGMLIALREVQFSASEVEPFGELEVQAQRVHTSDAASQYAFSVSREGQALAIGRATVVLRRST